VISILLPGGAFAGARGCPSNLSCDLDFGVAARFVPNAQRESLNERWCLIDRLSCWASFGGAELGAVSGEILASVRGRAVRSGRETDSQDSKKSLRQLAWHREQVI
jgi:hypothetical protein